MANGHRGRSPLRAIHHVALIASDYAASRRFYVDLLGGGGAR